MVEVAYAVLMKRSFYFFLDLRNGDSRTKLCYFGVRKKYVWPVIYLAASLSK
jgi:hypothetical protein